MTWLRVLILLNLIALSASAETFGNRAAIGEMNLEPLIDGRSITAEVRYVLR